MIPAPSPITNPDLLISKGTDAASGSFEKLSAFKLAKPPIPTSLIGASAPPVIAISK